MVPFADIFNHKAAVVALQSDFELVPACLMGGAADSSSGADSAGCADLDDDADSAAEEGSDGSCIAGSAPKPESNLAFSWELTGQMAEAPSACYQQMRTFLSP